MVVVAVVGVTIGRNDTTIVMIRETAVGEKGFLVSTLHRLDKSEETFGCRVVLALF